LRASVAAEGGEGGLTSAEISRYSRHLVLGDVGVAGQVALKRSAVLVIGAGGLGSPVLLYLAAAGVGHIGIVDADVVDESNLQRQVVHGTSTVGASKCESARRRIADVNPHVNVRTYEEEFTSETAMRILGEGFAGSTPWDVVVDGSDNFPTKYLINDACDILGLPWVYSAVLAFEGQVSTFNYGGDGPNYRDLLPSPPPPGDVPSCAEGGVLGVLPGTMGCLQATEVIKIVLGMRRGLLVGRCLVFDAIGMKFGEVGIARSPGRERATELIDYQGFGAGPRAAAQPRGGAPAEEGADERPPTTGGGRTVDEVPPDDEGPGSPDAFNAILPADCLDKLASGWSPWVLDVRLRAENNIVALPFTDAVVPHREVRRDHIPKDGDVLVYCKGGVRGKKACNRLVGLGVDPRRLYNLEGGILRWQKEVDPQMPRY
jgi:molybdopterin/thiamine biosynthesis adenylyltransferase/rhodanese-related sulfurtransferase